MTLLDPVRIKGDFLAHNENRRILTGDRVELSFFPIRHYMRYELEIKTWYEV